MILKAIKLLVNSSPWLPLCLDGGVQVLRMLGKDFPGLMGFQGGSGWEIRLPMQEMEEAQVQSLGWEDSLEKGMVTLSSILAWKISWTEESGEPQSMGSQNSRTQFSGWAHTHAFLI